MTMHALVHGLAITGASTVRALQRHGHDVTVTDDSITDAKLELATELGVALATPPAGDDLAPWIARFDVCSPAPGVPERHPIVLAAQAAGVPVRSEIEIAYRWEQERPAGPRPILAITGTDGKTSTTELTVAILRAAGLHTAALGNTEMPLLDAIDDDRFDAFVVECTSFRLAFTERFRADAAVWLNLAPDHLNWHESLDTYIAAKAKVFSQQTVDDVAIGYVDDDTVMRHLRTAPSRHRTFGHDDADYRVVDGRLVGPDGTIAEISSMRRRLPHDLTNALAASALALETGLADTDAIRRALAAFEAPEHRLEPIGASAGVAWYNDSKATTPHAAATAIQAFDSLVLIAGGSRKGVDLTPMATAPDRVRAVVAIGEAAGEIRAAFSATNRVVDARSMPEAIEIAAALALPGDAVVLSPGCASFDWYRNYEHRGAEFKRLVREHLAGHPADDPTDDTHHDTSDRATSMTEHSA